jgi:diacylglycerol kinase family enzyme
MLPPNFPVRHFFVVNPTCFENRLKMEAIIAGIIQFFDRLNNSSAWPSSEYAIHVSRFPRDAILAIREFAEAVPSGAPLRVYAVGGNGTLFDCLNGIIELPNVKLGIMPFKKGTDFHRVFNVTSMDVQKSLEVQIHAPSTPVDLLYCGSNYALCHCLVGIEALFGARGKMTKKRFPTRCISVFLRTFNINPMCFIGAKYPEQLRQNYHIQMDDKSLSGKYAFINICNSPCYKHLFMKSDPTDGYLDVLVCGEMNALESISVLHKYANGNYAKYPHLFTQQRVKKIILSSTQPFVLDLDGEAFFDKQITVEVIPQRVHIITPTQAYQE